MVQTVFVFSSFFIVSTFVRKYEFEQSKYRNQCATERDLVRRCSYAYLSQNLCFLHEGCPKRVSRLDHRLGLRGKGPLRSLGHLRLIESCKFRRTLKYGEPQRFRSSPAGHVNGRAKYCFAL
jgi:hypothetical protein